MDLGFSTLAKPSLNPPLTFHPCFARDEEMARELMPYDVDIEVDGPEDKRYGLSRASVSCYLSDQTRLRGDYLAQTEEWSYDFVPTNGPHPSDSVLPVDYIPYLRAITIADDYNAAAGQEGVATSRRTTRSTAKRYQRRLDCREEAEEWLRRTPFPVRFSMA
jgi:hypothetical protein